MFIYLYLLFVWFVYFSHLSESGKLFRYTCHCMNLLEYMGKTTQSVKGKFQESRESGKQIR